MADMNWEVQEAGTPNAAYTSKSGMSITRSCVLHVNHTATATHIDEIRCHLKEVMLLSMKYEIDIRGGDGDEATYKNFNHEHTPHYPLSSLKTTLIRCIDSFRRQLLTWSNNHPRQ